MHSLYAGVLPELSLYGQSREDMDASVQIAVILLVLTLSNHSPPLYLPFKRWVPLQTFPFCTRIRLLPNALCHLNDGTYSSLMFFFHALVIA